VVTEPIRFVAQVAKVQTLADGGIRITLDLSETAIMQAAELMVFKRESVPIQVRCTQARDRLDGKDSDG